MTEVRHAVRGGLGFTLAAVVIALVCGVWRPRWMRAPVIAVLMVCGLGAMGAGEYLREFLRKPWAVQQVVYANDVRAAQVGALQAQGVSQTANFLFTGDTSSPQYGAQLFQLQCGSCHSVDNYRSIKQRADGWDPAFAADILQHLTVMRGTMPPYAGNEADRKALGAYLASLNEPWHFTITDANRLQIGGQVFHSRCGHCHTINGTFRPLRGIFEKQAPADVATLFPALGGMSPDMPDFDAPDDQAQALAYYISQEANRPLKPGEAPVQAPPGATKSQLIRPSKPGQEVR
jgi:mono/diheme cytochrome c family protein